jgi:hypothetical protein
MRVLSWRNAYKVHPAADVFPMMSDEELATLGEDIKANGLKTRPVFWIDDRGNQFLLDGRNRLEAMERCNVALPKTFPVVQGDPVAHIIGLNIRRRHLTKEQQADLIVAAHKAVAAEVAARKADKYIGRNGEPPSEDKPRQVGEVSAKGGRGKLDKVKVAAVATAKEHGISRRTVERAMSKAERPKIKMLRHGEGVALGKPKTKPAPKAASTLTMDVGIEAARSHYALEFVALDHDERVAEWKRLYAALEAAVHEHEELQQ